MYGSPKGESWAFLLPSSRGDQDGLLQRLQSVYAQHEAEFEAERAIRLAQLGDPTALTPTQQLVKERQERAA